jgi:riboflavin synthase
MFTGIIEATGLVEALTPHTSSTSAGTGARLVVATSLDVGALPLGASIAVDGVCLTVVARSFDGTAGQFAADLGPETLAVTTLGALGVGARVHLERPLRLGDALGGHLVSGHVDGVGRVVARREIGSGLGAALELEIAAPDNVVGTLVEKGSVTVAGASLTINAVRAERFSVTLIPHTLTVTNLGGLAVGASVNIEADLIAKHVDRLVNARLSLRTPGHAQ